jgi:hypothetical protein
MYNLKRRIMPFPLIPVIAAGASMLGGLFNEKSRRKGQKLQRQHEMQLAEYSYSKDLEMWQRQNEYNAPTQQMARLREANLNPNLVYGSGSVVGNTTATTPKYQAPGAKYDYQTPVDIGGTISSYLDYEMKQSQIDYLEEQALTEAVKRTGMTADNELKTELSKYAYERAWNKHLKEASDAELSNFKWQEFKETYADRIDLLRQKVGKAKAERVVKELDAEIADSYGIRPGDQLYYRVFLQLMQKIFPDISEGFKKH